MVVDDYGHHPAEVKATLDGARTGYRDRRIVAAFQPHRYTRTRDLLHEFARSFNEADLVFVTDVYAAGVILFRAVAGHHAYRSESDGGLVRAKLTMDAPPLPSGREDPLAVRFAAIVAKSLRRKPNER